MSGMGAPARTATPMPRRATSSRLVATILPCLIRSSTSGPVRMAASGVAAPSYALLGGARGLVGDRDLVAAAALEFGDERLHHRLQRGGAQHGDLGGGRGTGATRHEQPKRG